MPRAGKLRRISVRPAWATDFEALQRNPISKKRNREGLERWLSG